MLCLQAAWSLVEDPLREIAEQWAGTEIGEDVEVVLEALHKIAETGEAHQNTLAELSGILEWWGDGETPGQVGDLFKHLRDVLRSCGDLPTDSEPAGEEDRTHHQSARTAAEAACCNELGALAQHVRRNGAPVTDPLAVFITRRDGAFDRSDLELWAQNASELERRLPGAH